MAEATTEGSGARELVAAYERFRAADAERHARLRARTGMGDNEVRLMQFVIDCGRDGRQVMPSEISRHLRISSASTTALLDRLERSGAIERITHPTDRRSILVAPTAEASDTLAAAVEEYECQLVDAADALDAATRQAVIRFFDDLTDAADDDRSSPGAR